MFVCNTRFSLVLGFVVDALSKIYEVINTVGESLEGADSSKLVPRKRQNTSNDVQKIPHNTITGRLVVRSLKEQLLCLVMCILCHFLSRRLRVSHLITID